MSPKSLESEHAIREHLAGVLSSAAFAQVDRLKRFLRYVVEETLAGRSEKLKEYPIGVEVFDRETSFDPRTDPIVRVQARRLRARLSRYYEDEGRHDQIRIELPKGSYIPVFNRLDARALKPTVATALASRNTITVLPFADRSPKGDIGYFCDGLSVEIIDALVKLHQLRVVAPPKSGEVNSSHAATIVSGSVRKSGNDIRIAVQFVDSANGS